METIFSKNSSANNALCQKSVLFHIKEESKDKQAREVSDETFN